MAFIYFLVLAVISLAIVIVSPTWIQCSLFYCPSLHLPPFLLTSSTVKLKAGCSATELLNNLEEAHQQLTEYTIQVEDLTLATERQRMARELHDTLAQGLAGLILQLEAAVIHIEGQNPEKAGQIVEQAMSRARSTLVDARRAIDDLRTDLNTPQALADNLQHEVSRFQTATGIPCKLQISLPVQGETRLSEHILRIITEGLWNIARHAEATQAAVSVGTTGDNIEIVVEDNGIGFNPDDLINHSGHYGLLGIRERVRLANGQYSIESEPGSGN